MRTRKAPAAKLNPTDAALRATMPRNMFRPGDGGSIACIHRDVSCCRLCEYANEEILIVGGVAFWVADLEERRLILDATRLGPVTPEQARLRDGFISSEAEEVARDEAARNRVERVVGTRETCFRCGGSWGACTCPTVDEASGPGFEFGHDWITDPSVSPCGRFYVEPVVFYAQAYLDFVKTDPTPLAPEVEANANAAFDRASRSTTRDGAIVLLPLPRKTIDAGLEIMARMDEAVRACGFDVPEPRDERDAEAHKRGELHAALTAIFERSKSHTPPRYREPADDRRRLDRRRLDLMRDLVAAVREHGLFEVEAMLSVLAEDRGL